MRDNFMRRDWDVLREIMLAFEDNPETAIKSLRDVGFSLEEIYEHINMAIWADLLFQPSVEALTAEKQSFFNASITHYGREFLSLIHSQEIWNEFLELISRNEDDLPMDMAWKILSEIVENKIKDERSKDF